MTKTKITNGTEVVITLKEGTAGMLRIICNLQPKAHYTVTSEVHQTYKEYWCIGHGSDQFTLSSDDLVEWKEIVIKPTSDPTKFHWEGKPPKKQGTPTEIPETPPQSSVWSRAFAWFSKSKPSGSTLVTTNVTTNPATAVTTITTSGPDAAKNTSTTIATPDAASSTTTVTSATVTSTVTSTNAVTPTPIT